MSKIKELQKKMKDLKAEMKKEGKVALKEAFKELFTNHPVLKAVQWEQYTPYFNDGDTCTFDIGNMYPVFVLTEVQKNIIGDGDDTELWDDFEYGNLKVTMTPEQKSASKALTKLVKDLGDLDEVLEDLFGDHARIQATKKGFKVTDYEHD